MKVLVCGDYYPYPEVTEYVNRNIDSDVSAIFGDLNPLIESADLSAINIEFPLTKSANPINKSGPCFKGDPIAIEPIAKAGFDLICMSNNHTLDFGIEGMVETMSLASQHGLDNVGCGKTLDDARKPFVVQKQGISLAILNFSENEFNFATESSGGANPLHEFNNLSDIRKAKRMHGNVLVIVHGGQDFCLYPPPNMVKRFRRFAEEGASAIICHHSHYISGSEIYKGVPIFYGIGNVIYPKFVDDERNKTIAIELDITENGIRVTPHRFFFEKKSFRLVCSKNREEDFGQQLDEISQRIQSMNLLVPSWLQGLRDNGERDRYLWMVMGYSQFTYKVLKKLRLLKFIPILASLRKKHLQTTLNLFRRETHRDAIIHILEEIDNGDTVN